MTQNGLVNEAAGSRQRHWVRWRRRYVIALVTLAILLVIFVPRYQRHQAVSLIRRSGGAVGVDHGPRWLTKEVSSAQYMNSTPGILGKPFHVAYAFGRDGRIPQDVLEAVIQLDDLQSVILLECGLTDDDLALIGQMHSIRTLSLGGNPITDEGLMNLQSLSTLRHVDVSVTNVTREGAKRFRDAMPNCTISLQSPGGQTVRLDGSETAE